MNKALVFGGAFNPVTNAHIFLAKYAMEKIHYDKVVFVPSKMSYIKDDQQKDFAIDDALRLEMLQIMQKENPWMDVCTYELTCEKQPRTFETLLYLQDQYEHIQLLFGSDKLLELETGWKHIDEIMHMFGIVCMQRRHDDCKHLIETNAYLKQYASYITLITTPSMYQSISSTKVRQLCANKQFDQLDAYIPKQIQSRIKEIYEKRND